MSGDDVWKNSRARALPMAIQRLLAVPGDQRTDAHRKQLADHYRSTDRAWKSTKVSKLPANLQALLRIPASSRTAPQQQAITDHFLNQDPGIAQRKAALADAQRRAANPRLMGAQDIAWALINSPAFLFNR